MYLLVIKAGVKFVLNTLFITVVVKRKTDLDLGLFLQVVLRFKGLLFDLRSKSDSISQKREASQVYSKICEEEAKFSTCCGNYYHNAALKRRLCKSEA